MKITKVETHVLLVPDYDSAACSSAQAHCPYIEFLPAALSESALRRELVIDDLELVGGQIALPHKPGLGIELNEEALERFRADRVVAELAR
jgi:L-alanine-DL-glutamate epimerase-like enolase superfamily enzyme